MDISLTLAPNKAIAAIPFIPEAQRPSDTKVPIVKAMDNAATLPADKAFVAQVVNARLSGAEFPENPAEIAPPERTLRPYDVPMLPADKEEPAFAQEEAGNDDAAAEPTEEVSAASADKLDESATTQPLEEVTPAAPDDTGTTPDRMPEKASA